MDDFEQTRKAYALAQSLPDENSFISVKDYFIEDDQVYINKRGDLGTFSGKKIDFVGHYDPENNLEDVGYYEERTGLFEPEYWESLKPKKVRISPPKKFVLKKKPLPSIAEEEAPKKFAFKKKNPLYKYLPAHYRLLFESMSELEDI